MVYNMQYQWLKKCLFKGCFWSQMIPLSEDRPQTNWQICYYLFKYNLRNSKQSLKKDLSKTCTAPAYLKRQNVGIKDGHWSKTVTYFSIIFIVNKRHCSAPAECCLLILLESDFRYVSPNHSKKVLWAITTQFSGVVQQKNIYFWDTVFLKFSWYRHADDCYCNDSYKMTNSSPMLDLNSSRVIANQTKNIWSNTW